jgi:AraC-like DNA-binding protein
MAVIASPGSLMMSSRLDHIADWEARAEQACYRVGILADLCGVTERQLRRYFRGRFGSTPHLWLASSRLHKSHELLSAGDLVKQAATEVHFSSQASFSRQFKRYYKINPSSVRTPVPPGALKPEMSDFDMRLDLRPMGQGV